MPEEELYRIRTDWDCLDRAGRGDEAAWRLLVQRHYARLVKMSALITGSIDAAKDTVQDAFLRLALNGAKHHEGSFAGYVSTIVYRLAVKEKRRSQRDLRLGDTDPPERELSALEAAIHDELEKLVMRVIQSLPDHHREVLVLRFYGGHSYEEIAGITGLPVGTVKSRVFYAVKTCREEFRKKGVR